MTARVGIRWARAAAVFAAAVLGMAVAAAGWFSAAAAATLVVANKEAGTVWLLDPQSGAARAKLEVGDGPHEVAVSPDGRRAVACNYGGFAEGRTLTVLDVQAARVVRTIDLSPHRRPHGIRFLDDRHVVVTSETSRALVVVDVEAGRILRAHDAGADVHMVELFPERPVAVRGASGSRDAVALRDDAAVSDGPTSGDATPPRRAVATGIGEGKLCFVDLAPTPADDPGNPRAPRTVFTGRGTEALALSPDGRTAWIGNNDTHTVTAIDTQTYDKLAEINVGLQPIRLAMTPDGRFLLASCILSGDLAVIDTKKRKVVRRVPLSDVFLREEDWVDVPLETLRPRVERVVREGARPIGVLVPPGGREAYVAARGLDHIAVVDLESWKVVRRLPTGAGPDGMAWSPR